MFGYVAKTIFTKPGCRSLNVAFTREATKAKNKWVNFENLKTGSDSVQIQNYRFICVQN